MLFIIVFDPLAVTMIIAFNVALKRDREHKIQKKLESKEYEVYGDEKSKDVDLNNNTESIFNTINSDDVVEPVVQPEVSTVEQITDIKTDSSKKKKLKNQYWTTKLKNLIKKQIK